MDIVVAGGGEVGLRIAEQLMASHNVTVIGASDRDLGRLEKLKIDVVEGSLTSKAVLEAAGVPRADVYIAVSRDDEKNIVSCVAAKRLGARRVICFLHRRGFFAVESDEEGLAESLGIDAIVRPAGRLADEIVRIVTVPGALDAKSFIGGRIQLQKFEVDEGSPLTSAPLMELKFPKGALIAMGQRGDEFFVPRGDTHFQAGDRATIIGTPKGIRRVNRFLAIRKLFPRKKRAIVVGGGLVGAAVAEGLVQAGWSVKVIEFDRQRCSDLAAQVDCLILNGDGADLELLEQECAFEPDALVAVTSNDEKNLLISLLAQHLEVPRVITRADRMINERIFERVGVDVVLSAKGAAIRRVVSDLVEGDNLHIAELELPRFAIIGAVIRREGRVRIPTGATALEHGDHLLVICDKDHEDDFHSALRAVAARERGASR